MRRWGHVLVFVIVIALVSLGVVLALHGDFKAAAALLVLAALAMLLLVEAWRPARHTLRRSVDGPYGNPLARMKRLRLDRPGIAGVLFIATLAALALAYTVAGGPAPPGP